MTTSITHTPAAVVNQTTTATTVTRSSTSEAPRGGLDRDRRYLIDIAAFDKLNHNSRIYNGPYTITMTDITGTER